MVEDSTLTLVLSADRWLNGNTAGSTASLNTKPASQKPLFTHEVQQGGWGGGGYIEERLCFS